MASWDKKLLTAAENGNIKEVELCVKNRANLECKGIIGMTPLMLAAGGGRLEVVTYLVTHGSQLDPTDEFGETPLMLAAWFGHLEVVTYLVTHGSQLDATDRLYGETALHYAAQYGGIDVTKCLIDQGCSPWVKSKQGKTPYDLVKIYSFDKEERKRKKEEVMDFLKTVMSKTSQEVSSDTHSQEPAAAVVEDRQDPMKPQMAKQSGTPDIKSALLKNKNKSEIEQTSQLKDRQDPMKPQMAKQSGTPDIKSALLKNKNKSEIEQTCQLKDRQDPMKPQMAKQSGTPDIKSALLKNKNKSEIEQTSQLKGSWFYKLVFSCDGKMVNIDSCESIQTCSNNGKWLLDVMSKGQNEISRYMNSLLALKEKEFEILLMFSTLFKRNLIGPEDWLLPAVQHQQNMACYMILAYLTGAKKEKKNVIIPALKMAIGKGDKYITKIISWFIIKELLKSFSFDINSLLDIWPAVVCKNMNCKDFNFCSQDLVILIETEQTSQVFPIQFWNIEIKYLSQAGIKMKKEVKDHVYRNTKFTGSASVEVCFPENFDIDGKCASKLFKDHSNLTLICKSLYTLKDGIKNYSPCVQLFCRSKGLIPVEENHFPKFINNVKTDVLEGESLLAGRLRVGEQINSKHFSGTLGGFVKVLGKITFLTCAHVVVNKDNLSGHNLTIPSNEAIYIDYVQTLPNSHNSQTKCCGEVRFIEFKTDSPGETSIDAALIKLRKGIEIDEDDFIANKINNKHNLQFLGMKSPFLNENWLDHEKIFDGKSALQFTNVTVGAVSGISVNTDSKKEKDEGFDIDRETVIETYKRIVQSENVSTFSSNAPVFSNDAHLQETRLRKVDKERTRYRLSRRMYNQIAVTHIPFQPGDSGTCIYVCDNSLERYGCIGMAIANHPGIDGGAIVTPMKDILKTFHLDIQ